MRHNKPIVALESTIITHGMPFPQNYETAKEVEDVVRSQGAVPATIAILNGQIQVGLDDSALKKLAQIGLKCRKVSRRDLASVVAEKANGGTTVAATMLIADKAGISVFVTGGIGGVHRGFEETMDVSADLTELGKTPVCVVCAGVKSILDIPRTLEFLETQGVNVMSFGQDQFPAFFVPDSGVKSPRRVDTPKAIAEMIEVSKNELRLQSGMVVAVPVPSAQAAETAEIEHATEKALNETIQKGIKGKDVTPYLLLRIAELTEGRSLAANIALVKNNATVGSRIAVQLAEIQKENRAFSSGGRAVVVGGCSVDSIGFPKPSSTLTPATSTPGLVKESAGGVGLNISLVLGSLGHQPAFVSVIGKDQGANIVMKALQDCNVDQRYVKQSETHPTARYFAIHDERRDLSHAIADFAIVENELTPSTFDSNDISHLLDSCEILLIDGNVPAVVDRLKKEGRRRGLRVWFEPVSIEKSLAALDANSRLDGITYISPNSDEMNAICKASNGPVGSPSIQLWRNQCKHLQNLGVETVFLTLGERGVFVSSSNCAELVEAVQVSKIESTSGAGDCFVAGTVSGLLSGLSVLEAARKGVQIASLSLQTTSTVPIKLLRKRAKL